VDVEDSESKPVRPARPAHNLFGNGIDKLAVPDDKLPPHVFLNKYEKIGNRPLERAHRVEVALGMAVASHVKPGVRQADRIVDSAVLERAEQRLQFLRQVQTLIDETDAKIALRKMNQREQWWQDDETPIRDAVDDWDDELPEKESAFRFKYRTPKPQSAKLDKMAEVLKSMDDCWLSVDLDLQARGYRPNKDKNQYRRESGTKPSPLGAGGINEALRRAMPELFGVESYQARDGKLRREAPKTPTQKLSAKIDPWDEIKMIMNKSIDRAAEDAARQERKFEGMSRKRRHGVD
jgi:hypothetical protein